MADAVTRDATPPPFPALPPRRSLSKTRQDGLHDFFTLGSSSSEADPSTLPFMRHYLNNYHGVHCTVSMTTPFHLRDEAQATPPQCPASPSEQPSVPTRNYQISCGRPPTGIHHGTSDASTPTCTCQGSNYRRRLFLPGVWLCGLRYALQGRLMWRTSGLKPPGFESPFCHLLSWFILGKVFDFSVPRSPCLYNGDNNNTYYCWWLGED